VAGALWASQGTVPLPAASLIQTPRLLGSAGEGARHLTYVADELAAIAARLPGATVAPVATSDDLRATPAPSLLHIAAHGQTNPTTPLCSTIELADGPFLLLEAHRLRLSGTALVVLSACETGERPDHGDMALALAGAFLCAGARGVIASLWPVDDAATADLMGHFYAGLAAGVGPAAALRAAQAATREAFPLDWAAFQLWAGAMI
jgi:CHAT domain-containing protein